MADANNKQPGGNHYKKFGELQPWDVTLYFGLGFLDGNACKYILRWRHKGGILDLEKAGHYIEKLIEVEKAKHANQDKKRRSSKRSDNDRRGSSRR